MEQSHYSLVEWLPIFFQQWPDSQLVPGGESDKTNIDSMKLAEFFNQLSLSLKTVQHRALFFDPWEVAELGRKEVRNTSVLAWILDPEGTHGFGRVPLKTLLELICQTKTDIPEDYTQYCRVLVETNPVGDNTNRVDIEIDADNFFLLIEVKIDAKEQQGQIERYCTDAKIRAKLGPKSRPWAVIFLTPHGGRPLTMGASFKPEDVPCISWQQLAAALAFSLQEHYQALVAGGQSSTSHQSAAHAAFCFLKRISTF